MPRAQVDPAVEFPSLQNVKERISLALSNLYLYESDLFSVDANERSITHKLAEYLQAEFKGWNVDCEYNRRGLITKKVRSIVFGEINPDDTEAKTVFPDIIVHRRDRKDNLLVIEVKKVGTRTDSIERDLDKLRGFCREETFLYKYGLFLILGESWVSRTTLCHDGREEDWCPSPGRESSRG